MSESNESVEEPKSKAWMYLVAAFSVLVLVGILTS